MQLGSVVAHIRGAYKWLAGKFPVETGTIKNYLLFLGIFILLPVIEYASLYLSEVNNTFMNPLLQGLPLFVAFSAPVLLFGKWGSRIYMTVLLPVLWLVVCVSVLLSFHFHIQLDGDIIPVVLASSEQETVEFLGFLKSASLIIIVLVFLLGLGGMMYLVWRRPLRVTRYTVILGVLLLLPYTISTVRYIVIGKGERSLNRASCTRLVFNYVLFQKEFGKLREMAKNPEIPPNVRRTKPEVNNLAGVIVIGESATRNHMGIYGYPRATDAEMRKAEPPVLAYNDVISAYTTTTWAIRYLMTMSEIGANRHDAKCSLVDIFKQGGFKVNMISNQYRWGKYDGPISLVFVHADSMEYLQEAQPNVLDDALLGPCRKALAESEGPVIVILHLMGSHIGYDSRYPSDFGPFDALTDDLNRQLAPEYARLLNEYDNSIAFTDQVLGGVVAELKKLDRPAFMLYVADHGEVVSDGVKTFRSASSRNPDAYEIPFLVWLSKSYREKFPEFTAEAEKNLNMPLQTDKAFWGIAALAQLTWDGFPDEKNFFSTKFKPQPRTMDSGKVPYEKARK